MKMNRLIPLRLFTLCLGIPFVLYGCGEKIPHKARHTINYQILQYSVQGTGGPCVVFESGLGMDMDSWVKVFPEVAKITTAFAYNRPGYGGSKPRMGANTGKRIVSKLHALLHDTGCHPPYILVGHSLGGLFINMYARTYPDEIAGIVFVDSSHPDQEKWSRKNMKIRTSALSLFFGYLHRKKSFPPELYEYYDVDDISKDLRRSGPFPDVPVRVITSGKKSAFVNDSWAEQWSKFQKDLASLSPQGKQIIAEGSGHFIQNDQPQLVIDTIQEIINITRKVSNRQERHSHAF
jgi:pimeloyl-ACP methyl ester carboxylesterase